MTTQLERGEESVPQQEEENIPEDAKDLATYVCCRFLFFRGLVNSVLVFPRFKTCCLRCRAVFKPWQTLY